LSEVFKDTKGVIRIRNNTMSKTKRTNEQTTIYQIVQHLWQSSSMSI